MTIRIIGNHVSPFVRKALAVCRLKGVAHEIDPIVPFFGDERFTALSPLRRIPVLIDRDVAVPGSSIIANYLEDLQPVPTIYPGSAAERARARFFDDFADSRMAKVILWDIFAKAVVAPGIFKSERDLAAISRHVSEDLPGVMDILEHNAPDAGFIAGTAIGIGDLSVATHFANLRWARQSLDANLWPRAAAWISRVEAHDALKPLNDLGNLLVRQPPAQYRATLAAAGVTLTTDTFATTTPRRVPTSQI